MVNEVILKYLRDNRANYPLAALKRELISKGHSEASVNAAADLLKKPAVIKEDKAMKPFVGRKWFLFSSILGFVFFFFGLLTIGLSVSKRVLAIDPMIIFLPFILVLILGCFYFYGFVRLGGRVGSKFLKVSSILSIITTAFLLVFYIWLGLFKGFDKFFSIFIFLLS